MTVDLPTPPRGFRHVPGFPGYAVNRMAVVLSCRRVGGRGIAFTADWHRLKQIYFKPVATKPAYHTLHLRHPDGHRRKTRVHHIVLTTFVGPCPTGMEGCHRNGVGTDNRLRNLRWGTSVSNNADKLRHGTHLRGERVGNSKLTEMDIREIRASRAMSKDLAVKLGVSPGAVQLARARKTWKHVH